jgi:hypothetical protein
MDVDSSSGGNMGVPEEHFLSGFFDCSVLLELRSDQIIEINPC